MTYSTESDVAVHINEDGIIEETFLIVNTYLRSVSSNKQALYASHSDIGVSTLFFKKDGNFMGGIYLELPDLDQNNERMKANPEYEDWYNRMAFGIYTKFSFDPLLSLN